MIRAAFAPTPARRFVDNGEVTLCVETYGEGPRALLFAHGWISSRRMWYDVVARLDPAVFTAHLLDFRGAGISDRPPDGHDLEGYASDLRVAIAAIDRPLTLVAHSMGAKVTQYVALDPPDALRRMLLVAPGTATAFKPTARHRELTLAAFGSRARIEKFQRGAMRRELSRATMDRIVEDALLAQREAWFGWYDQGRAADFSDQLHRIHTPTVILGGDHDPLSPASRLRRDVAGPIAGALFVQLKDVGHNIPVETPTELAGAIERFALD